MVELSEIQDKQKILPENYITSENMQSTLAIDNFGGKTHNRSILLSENN